MSLSLAVVELDGLTASVVFKKIKMPGLYSILLGDGVPLTNA
jgi:hypothetical protein